MFGWFKRLFPKVVHDIDEFVSAIAVDHPRLATVRTRVACGGVPLVAARCLSAYKPNCYLEVVGTDSEGGRVILIVPAGTNGQQMNLALQQLVADLHARSINHTLA